MQARPPLKMTPVNVTVQIHFIRAPLQSYQSANWILLAGILNNELEVFAWNSQDLAHGCHHNDNVVVYAQKLGPVNALAASERHLGRTRVDAKENTENTISITTIPKVICLPC